MQTTPMQRAAKAAKGPRAVGSSRARSTIAICRAAVTDERIVDKTKKPCFPFVKIAGQEDMKLALCLNVVDPNIGGCLIMGDRGTGKSVAVRSWAVWGRLHAGRCSDSPLPTPSRFRGCESALPGPHAMRLTHCCDWA